MDNFCIRYHDDSADNMAFYSDPVVDQALIDARSTVDTDERIAKYQAIVKTIGEAAPVIPIVDYRHYHVGSERVRGLVYSPQGLLNLEQAWIAAVE
jgi:ABC-type transport system substrate-binding protein